MPDILKRETVYQGRVFQVQKEQIDLNNARPAITREIVTTSDSATIALVNPKGQVLIEREYRAPIGRYSWALPAGRVNPGEQPVQTAQRELAEETGYQIATDQFHQVDQVSLSNGVLNEFSHLFIVFLHPDQFQRVNTHFDDSEDITQVDWVDLKTALSKTDGAASHLALLHLQLLNQD